MLETAGTAAIQAIVKALIDRMLTRKPSAPAAPESQSYAVDVGHRIRILRQDLLGLSMRQMCEVIGLSQVSQLEAFEAGAQEFPLQLTRELEARFFLNPDFLDGGTASVFRSFSVDTPTCAQYLAQGFSPVVICNPSERGDLYSYITFEREAAGYREIHVGNLLCSFNSNGGGRLNLQYLIHALEHVGLLGSAVKIYRVSSRAWEAARFDCYQLKTADVHLRCSDWECMEIWRRWCEESGVRIHSWAM